MKENSELPNLTPIVFVRQLKEATISFVSKENQNQFHNDHMLKNLVIVFETPAEAIFDQVMCILFRLTQKPSGSLVPLRDLLDKVQTKDGFKWGKTNNHIYLFFRRLFAELAAYTEFPFGYYPSSAVFERDKDTLKRIIVVENVKSVLSGTCPHCNGNFAKNQVEAFTNDNTITCEYCHHSIKAEWTSKKRG